MTQISGGFLTTPGFAASCSRMRLEPRSVSPIPAAGHQHHLAIVWALKLLHAPSLLKEPSTAHLAQLGPGETALASKVDS
jgi:hypothetical protein